MLNSKIRRYLLIIGLVVMLALVPVIGTGCAGQSTSGAIASTLAATMVPDVNLDVYLYFNQGSPTIVPKSFVGTANDIPVNSLALWGIVNNENAYTVGGALTFASAADASNIYTMLPPQTNLWTQLSGSTIYVVQGSGGPAESLKSAISNNKFIKYNDSKALSEVSQMPLGDATRPDGIGIIKPNKAAVDLLKKHVDAGTANTIDSIFTWGKPQLIITGLYSSQPINVANLAQGLSDNSIWDANLGVVVSIDSAYPGVIVNPIASRVLSNSGYTQVSQNNITEYQTSFNAGNGRSVPVLINVSGNHVYVTASGNADYAQTLMTGIKR